MLNMFAKLSIFTNEIAKKLTVFILAFMTVIILLQVILREVFGTSLLWTEELSRFSLVWATFFGASICLCEGSHISLDFFIEKTSKKFRRILTFITWIIVLIILVIFIYYSMYIAFINWNYISPSLKIPLFWPKIGLPISGLFMLIHNLHFIVAFLFENRGDKL